MLGAPTYHHDLIQSMKTFLFEMEKAIALMSEGATVIVQGLYHSGRLDGILSLGGTMGTFLATGAMRALPVGVPKVMVSTVAAWDTSMYLGTKDITMIPPLADILGLNMTRSMPEEWKGRKVWVRTRRLKVGRMLPKRKWPRKEAESDSDR